MNAQPIAPDRSTGERSGGRLLVDALRREGVDRVFCVPGESYLEVLDALLDSDIHTVVARHEGAAANMAEADGKLTGRPGIAFVTRGPGATHAAIGVHIAAQDSTPLILFVGQVATPHLGREAFQELDYRAVFGPMAKWAAQVESVQRLPEMVARAFHVACSGRPGPVVLALPEDVLAATAEVPDVAPLALSPAAPPADVVPRLAEALARAQRPLLIVGGTGWDAEARAALHRFAEGWRLPVACGFRRQDLFDPRSHCYAGHLALGADRQLVQAVREADLVIALGSRLGDITSQGYGLFDRRAEGQRLVQVHPDAQVLGGAHRPDWAIVSAMVPMAAALDTLTAPADCPWPDWTQRLRANVDRFSQPPAAPATGVDLAAAVRQLRALLPDDAIATNGAGNYAVWLHRFWQYRGPRAQLAPTAGAMGYGLPAAIAAKLRHPQREVVCFAGDGCFQMFPQELATAAQEGAAVLVIVVNNGQYGTIRMHQERRFPGRVSATELLNPDFVQWAQACGAHGERVEHTQDFLPAVARARASGRPALVELVVDARQLTPDFRLADA